MDGSGTLVFTLAKKPFFKIPRNRFLPVFSCILVACSRGFLTFGCAGITELPPPCNQSSLPAIHLKRQCHKMNNLFEGLKNQISTGTFCICADGF
jgi:hypothetical protein